MANLMQTAIKAARANAPGVVVSCSWARITGSTYNPATGTMANTTSTATFTGIRGAYRRIERLVGIEAGDVQLAVDANDLPAMPERGAVIVIDGVAYEVVEAKDHGKMAYELQMRRK